MVGSPTPSLRLWKQLALWSLEYSRLSSENIEKAIEQYEKDWEAFIELVVKELSIILSVVPLEAAYNGCLKKMRKQQKVDVGKMQKVPK